MKFIHIADVHLGAEPEAGAALRGRRGREIWDTFEHVIDVCEEQNTDLLLIAGDLFEGVKRSGQYVCDAEPHEGCSDCGKS